MFMFRIAVEPPQGDQDSMPTVEWRSKLSGLRPATGRFRVVDTDGEPVKKNVFLHLPDELAGIS